MNLSPVFNRNNLENKKSRKFTVNIRVSINGKSDYLKIQGFPRLEKRHWDSNKHAVSNSHPFHIKLNKILEREIDKIDRFFIDELDKERELNLQDIRYFYENQKQRESFNEFVKLNIRKYVKENELEHRTYQVYNTFLKHLNEFNSEIRFYEINRQLINDFNLFMKVDQIINDKTRKKIRGAARKKYFDKFKVMYKEAAKANLVKYDELLFDKLKIPIEKSKRTSLSKEEIIKIRDLDLEDSPNLIQTRDEFLFLCFSGLYYNDIKTLTEKNLVKTKVGYVVDGLRTKNDERFITPIYKFQLAVEIIQKYWRSTDDHFLFPNTISEGKFNEKLKILASKANIDKNITNKVGRHSFMDLMISQGLERQFVSRMVGHANDDTTQIYYDMNVDHIVNSKFGEGEIEL